MPRQRKRRHNAGERWSEITQNSANGTNLAISPRKAPYGRRMAKTVTEGHASRTAYYLNGDSALKAEADAEGRLTRARPLLR